MSFHASFPDTAVVLPPQLPVGSPPSLLNRLLDGWVVLPEEWEETPADVRAELNALTAPDPLLARLVDRHLLTKFQADCVRRGMEAELILGQYRLLQPIGRGGMGAVYRAEHVHLRREVAIKVLSRSMGANPRLSHRFYAEARSVARLQHPNIVACLDAGRHDRPGAAPRDYYVMELIPGSDLQEAVRLRGPLPPGRVCDLFRQVAEGLAEAHRLGLVHRDIKPSNVLVTPDWQAKLLDFGLALQPDHRLTEPGTLLGTVGYMAPEQAQSPHAVDARADLFSLGATMYWALSGREPYPQTGNMARDLHVRLNAPPAEVRLARPEVPAELAELIVKLTDPDPDRRYQSARAVAGALAGLTRWVAAAELASDPDGPRSLPRVLIADDDPAIRALVRAVLADCDCHEAEDGREAWRALEEVRYDLLVLDVNLPGASGTELLGRLHKLHPDGTGPRVLMVSGDLPTEALGGLLLDGADDFLEKPFTATAVRSRARGLLCRRPAAAATPPPVETPPPVRFVQPVRDTVRLTMADVTRPAAVTPAPQTRADQSLSPADPLAYAACRLMEETGLTRPGYHARLGRYLRALAAAAPDHGEYSRLKTDRLLAMLAAVAPAHDVGQLVLPTHVLMKPDRLTSDEHAIVQTHTVLGSQVLIDIAARLPVTLPDLTLAAEVVRHHHERWDGAGYPDGLAGAAIPLAARAVAVASVYEALRTRRPHRPALGHARAVRQITVESPGQFDPTLVAAFAAAASRFDEIFQSCSR
ncbi:MAG TPA: protein kinase [Gemmataceae bacterium]|nr:protein kinase [Gemmataceae bacterium]